MGVRFVKARLIKAKTLKEFQQTCHSLELFDLHDHNPVKDVRSSELEGEPFASHNDGGKEMVDEVIVHASCRLFIG